MGVASAMQTLMQTADLLPGRFCTLHCSTKLSQLGYSMVTIRLQFHAPEEDQASIASPV
jgi:hypothetical protein